MDQGIRIGVKHLSLDKLERLSGISSDSTMDEATRWSRYKYRYKRERLIEISSSVLDPFLEHLLLLTRAKGERPELCMKITDLNGTYPKHLTYKRSDSFMFMSALTIFLISAI